MNVKHERPVALFTFVQVMGVCAMMICALFFLGCLIIPVGECVIQYMREDPSLMLEPLLTLLLCAAVGSCLMWLLTEFVLMCGRVRKETAFTAVNVRALGRIALAFFIGGGLMLPLGKPMMDTLLLGMRGFRSPIWWLLPSFVAWAAALMVRAIQVLMRRAVEMQTEADLTV